MWEPSYLALTRSISWLLMPWLLASPGHQQPWYQLCKITKSWSYTRKNFNYLWHVRMEEWIKCKYIFMFPLNNLVREVDKSRLPYLACHIRLHTMAGLEWPAGQHCHVTRRGQCRGALLFSLICAWINDWVVRLVIWDAIAAIMTPL